MENGVDGAGVVMIRVELGWIGKTATKRCDEAKKKERKGVFCISDAYSVPQKAYPVH
jgi:hypothetical protein